MVTGTGEILHLEGDQLRMVCGLEGITGLITRVTLKVAREAPLHVWALGYLNLDDLIRALHNVFDSDWPCGTSPSGTPPRAGSSPWAPTGTARPTISTFWF